VGERRAGRAATVGLALAAGVCLVLAGQARGEFTRLRGSVPEGAELMLFPAGHRLTEMSLGHPQLLADLGWLAAIQYYGKHRQENRRYPLAPHLFEVITEADPRFRNAYIFGALVVAEDGNLAAAERLLQRGVARNPESWELAFELGFFQAVYRRDWPAAGRAFRQAAARPGAPEYVTRFAAAACERADRPDAARRLWERVARETNNAEVRRIALERLRALPRAAASPEEGA
jgi:hypothetical protein